MPGDLSGVLAKLDRADEHREAFDLLYHAYAESQPYGILTEYDPRTGWHVLRWQVMHEPPFKELALIFGDMISNLRAALDYLIWQLVLQSGNRPGRRTAFPVVRRAKDWDVQSRNALRGVTPEWIAEIEARQPFKRRERPSIHPLAILDHLNNLNKHRFLPVAAVSVEQLGLLINVEDARGEPIESRDFVDQPIVHGGELARFRVPSKAYLDVIVNQAPRARLSFDDGIDYDWYPVELAEWVKETVALFGYAFPRV